MVCFKVVGIDIRKEHQVKDSNYVPMMADMSKEADIQKCFKEIKDKHGPVHVLVNNAGVLENTTLFKGDIAKWKKTLDINIMGLCTCLKEGIAQMTQNKIDGHIINVASVLGHFISRSPFNIYTASKHGVSALTESLRLELADDGSDIKICVSYGRGTNDTFYFCFRQQVCPGIVQTEIFTVNDFVKGKGLQQAVDEAPKLSPADIAGACWFMIDQPTEVNVKTKPHNVSVFCFHFRFVSFLFLGSLYYYSTFKGIPVNNRTKYTRHYINSIKFSFVCNYQLFCTFSTRHMLFLLFKKHLKRK